MKRLISASLAVIPLVMVSTGATAGVIYDVNRAWTNGSTNASLVGTVDVDIGTYNIQNAGSAPFNAVNLTLTVGVTNYNVNNVLTGFIFGTGLFTIQATATQLIFTATGDGYTGAADLDFSDGGASDNRYVIGSDADPHFEGAVTGAGNVFANSEPVYPLVWATAATSVPEPSTLTLFGLGLAGLGLMRRRRAA